MKQKSSKKMKIDLRNQEFEITMITSNYIEGNVKHMALFKNSEISTQNARVT